MTSRASRPTVLLALALGPISVLLGACTDNATRLSHAIERAAAPPGVHSTTTVPYQPKKRPAEPYTLIFFPEHATTQASLVAAGVSKELAVRIFTELRYVGVGHHAMLVVVQESERLSFTSHWRRFASVDELLVLRGIGARHLVLEGRDSRVIVEGLE